MRKTNRPLTPAQRMKNKRLRDLELHLRLGGKEKRIHLYDFTVNHIDMIMKQGCYSGENEAITDALAVAAMIIDQDNNYFINLLEQSRTSKLNTE